MSETIHDRARQADEAIPTSFIDLVKRQQADTVKHLRAQADAVEALEWPRYAHNWGVHFQPGDPDYEKMLEVTGTTKLSDHDGSVTLRRFPTKQAWAWRVETGRSEWYVSYERIVEAWS